MSSDLEARQRKHVLFTWSAQSQASSVPIASGKGATFTDHDGERWLDFESQTFNCNAGHGEARIISAMADQAASLACAAPSAVFEAKAALGERLAAVTPGDLNRFFLCLSGAEAVENALKIARMVTGRTKVIARRRSYHGASMGALSLTGDARRLAVEPGLWGVVRAEDPYCHRCPFGLEHPSCGVRCATHLEHIIQMEGPDRIAAVFMEGITGANGGFVPPDDYWPTVREICDRYGILLVADEVFSGFGRAGRWFAVDHWGVTPDMITMAKGLTSGYAPLGAVAMRDHIADRFADEKLWCGLTSYAHPVSCAAAVASIDVYQQDQLIEAAARLETPMLAAMNGLKQRFGSLISDVRGRGLFGTMELDRDTAPITEALRKRRVHLLAKGPNIFVCPPLCITQDELEEGIDLIGQALQEVF